MDLKGMVLEAQKMQQRIGEVQAALAARRVTGASGAGLVRATVTGRQELVELLIEPGVLDPADIGMLQDLIVAAVNDALLKSRQLAREEMTQATGGLNLNIPGLF